MNIDLVVEKYITEGNRKDDFEKWVKVVNSSKTQEQLETAIKMGQNYYSMYGESWFKQTFFDKDEMFSTPLADKMLDLVRNKKNKLSHEEAQKILKEIK